MSASRINSSVSQRGFRITFLSALLILICLLSYYQSILDWDARLLLPAHRGGNDAADAERHHSEVAIVVASQKRDNTTWVSEAFPEWQKVIYTTDDENAENTVPANKGRENMVYLTQVDLKYIIENYERLPDTMIFQHANRYQWHNDDPLYDGVRMLSRLNLQYVREAGFVNLRCVWTLGCPVEIRPLAEAAFAISMDDSAASKARAGWYYKTAWEELFPNTEVPREIGSPCCSQFAVTAETVRKRSKQEYEGYRTWLLRTNLRDDLSGRILEYAWHVIFHKGAVYCPNARECYCNLYGICDLQCESDGVCAAQYTLPKYSTMPKGWPYYDWDGKWQNASDL